MTAAAVPLRIGDVAARVGTTTRTIRYYEEIGLLPGGEARRAGAHRLYGEEDVERLRELLRLKGLLGLSLDELREIAAGEAARAARRAEWEAGVDPERRSELLGEALAHVERQLALVERRRAELDELAGELVERRDRVQRLLG